MNRRDLENQLAQLEEGDPFDGDGKANKSIFEPLPENWKPSVRIQPQNGPDSDPAAFQIGDRDERYRERQALPKFRYPNSGQPLPREIESAERQYSVTREIAGSHLRDSIRYVVECDLLGHTPGLNDFEAMRSEKWGYLLGLWAGHQIAPPSEKQMQEWAHELIAEWRSKSASLSEIKPG